MTINRLNYEIFFIDYLDGKLSALQVDELLLFLDQNPDIKDELEGIENAVLVADSTPYQEKSSLKKKSFLKDGIDNEFDYLCISATEGLLNKEERQTFEKSFENDPSKQRAYRDFQKLKLNPIKDIRYQAKAHLKRFPIIPIRYSQFRATISVAATITFLLGVYTLGRVLIKENPIDNAPIIVESVNSFSSSQEVLEIKTAVAIFEKRITSIGTSMIKSTISENKTDQTKEEVIIDREEYIPNPLKRKKIVFESAIDPQASDLTQVACKLNPPKQVDPQLLLAQQRELSTIETVQNGLKALSRLIGRDIKLEAKKDEKGNVEKISFESKFLAFSTQVKND